MVRWASAEAGDNPVIELSFVYVGTSAESSAEVSLQK